jgi:acyl carrier protein
MQENSNVEVIRHLIAEVLEVDAAVVQDKVNFITDLGADSLRVIEILARLERELGVSIPQAALMRMDSLDAVVEVVAESQLATI